MTTIAHTPVDAARTDAGARRQATAIALLLSLAAVTTVAAQQAPAAAPVASPTAASAPGAADPEPTRALHALFERQWEWSAREFPEFATYRGDHRFGDRLADMSAEAIAARDRASAEFLQAARAIQRERLGATDRVSLDIFIDRQQRFADEARFPAARGMSLTALGGPHTHLADLLQVMPMDRAERVRQAIARLHAVPRRMDQEIAQLRASAAAGWVPARDVLRRTLAQIDAQVDLARLGGVDGTPFFQPFTRLGSAITPPEREALQAAAREAVTAHVLPALQRLRALVADELLPRAPAEGSLANYPGGADVYAMHVRHHTTTDLSAQQIHDLGLAELARLRGGMEAVMKEVGWSSDFAAFAAHLYGDPKYFHTSGEALLAGYRDIAKRIDAELPKLFAELPRTPYGIRPMPPHLGANRAEYYSRPALDGSRAGFFFANALAFRKRPVWGMETLVAHETVPGHHLQIARASELRGLPPFRRGGFGYTAFSEGWALYAETLGFELGLYADPLSRYGHLMWQAFRAARLVVDTGIHAKGWTRAQAIDFVVERTGVEREFVESEIDRYASQPGQALAYMIGKLEFDRLRDRAKARLGERFDIRRFHNAVLDHGALPLGVLERTVDEWLAAEAAAQPASSRSRSAP